MLAAPVGALGEASPPRTDWSLDLLVGLRTVNRGAYGGEAAHLLDRMGAETEGGDGASSWIGLAQTLVVNDWLAVSLRQRLWTWAVGGRFRMASDLDYEFRRWIVPINLVPQLVHRAGPFRMALGGGPGIYVLHTSQRGHLGEGSQLARHTGFFACAEIWGDLPGRISMGLQVAWDRFAVPPVNPVLHDGGDAGGLSVAMGLRLRP